MFIAGDHHIVVFVPTNLIFYQNLTMLKITSIAIGLLTVVSMAAGAQAMPREIYSPSGQPSVIHSDSLVNHRGESEHHNRQQVNHRRHGEPAQIEGRRRQYRAQRHHGYAVYHPQRSESHRHHGRYHSNVHHHY
jgi:hypothetical protein